MGRSTSGRKEAEMGKRIGKIVGQDELDRNLVYKKNRELCLGVAMNPKQYH